MTEIMGEFQVTGWEEGDYDEATRATRVTVRKSFSGDIEGSSVAELLGAGAEGGRGYVASEFFTGSVLGRKGTLIIQHGGLLSNPALLSQFALSAARGGPGWVPES
ncbi:MAG TPA: DUF3224 domain-containing protein [Candidatus Limnocylindrales bacterium]|nr:DUF3224 domain-containing protein [Candidatus Limnocylindrales bacterium]